MDHFSKTLQKHLNSTKSQLNTLESLESLLTEVLYSALQDCRTEIKQMHALLAFLHFKKNPYFRFENSIGLVLENKEKGTRYEKIIFEIGDQLNATDVGYLKDGSIPAAAQFVRKIEHPLEENLTLSTKNCPKELLGSSIEIESSNLNDVLSPASEKSYPANINISSIRKLAEEKSAPKITLYYSQEFTQSLEEKISNTSLEAILTKLESSLLEKIAKIPPKSFENSDMGERLLTTVQVIQTVREADKATLREDGKTNQEANQPNDAAYLEYKKSIIKTYQKKLDLILALYGEYLHEAVKERIETVKKNDNIPVDILIQIYKGIEIEADYQCIVDVTLSEIMVRSPWGTAFSLEGLIKYASGTKENLTQSDLVAEPKNLDKKFPIREVVCADSNATNYCSEIRERYSKQLDEEKNTKALANALDNLNKGIKDLEAKLEAKKRVSAKFPPRMPPLSRALLGGG